MVPKKIASKNFLPDVINNTEKKTQDTAATHTPKLL
jgi:hypothetical protein